MTRHANLPISLALITQLAAAIGLWLALPYRPPQRQSYFVDPEEILVLPDASILVEDEDRSSIIHVTLSGTILAEYGNASPLTRHIPNGFWTCDAIALAPTGELLLLEIFGHRSRIFVCGDSPSDVLRVLPCEPTPAGPLQGPEGLAVDAAGRIHISSEDNRKVLIYALDGSGLGGFDVPGEPEGIDVLPDGSLIACTFPKQDDVGLFRADGSPVKVWRTWDGDGFDEPESVCFSPAGDELYVGDSGNGRVLVFDTRGRWLRTISGFGYAEGQLQSVDGLDFTPAGSLVVCDPDGQALVLFSQAGEHLGTIRPISGPKD